MSRIVGVISIVPTTEFIFLFLGQPGYFINNGTFILSSVIIQKSLKP